MSANQVVILNLAERDGVGPVGNVRDALQTRYPERKGIAKKMMGDNKVSLMEMIPFMDQDKNGALKRSDLDPYRTVIGKSTKVLLCTHGIPTDTDHGYLKASGGAPFFNVHQLASFILALFPKREPDYHLALVMCYGARTATFMPRQMDQQSLAVQAEIKTSFAFKLFARICQARNVSMTARTGAVQFDRQTTNSLVETEASVNARIEKEEFLRSTDTNDAIDKFKIVKSKFFKTEAGAMKFTALQEKYKNDPNSVALTPDERTIKEYCNVLRKKNNYTDLMNQNPDRNKYGKILYTYKAPTVTVTNKYGAVPDGGVPPGTVLYQGLLV